MIATKSSTQLTIHWSELWTNHLACAAAIAVLDVMKQEHLVENAAMVGAYLMEELKKFPQIKEVRGQGLMIGMEFERSKLNPVGGNRHGVIRISKFFKDKVGDSNGNITTDGWFYISEQFLLEATNGKIFCDNFGLMTDIRNRLSYLPKDIRLKKLAGNILVMAQSGQYNYKRCIDRQETGAAQLAIGEFVNATLKVIFLLNKKYMPYYKWSFRALKDLELLSELSDQLEYLISSTNTKKESELKIEIIENIAKSIINELEKQSLTRASSNNLVNHAYSINDKIQDSEIRNLNVMYAV